MLARQSRYSLRHASSFSLFLVDSFAVVRQHRWRDGNINLAFKMQLSQVFSTLARVTSCAQYISVMYVCFFGGHEFMYCKMANGIHKHYLWLPKYIFRLCQNYPWFKSLNHIFYYYNQCPTLW
jgi:hypothetical protein